MPLYWMKGESYVCYKQRQRFSLTMGYTDVSVIFKKKKKWNICLEKLENFDQIFLFSIWKILTFFLILNNNSNVKRNNW